MRNKKRKINILDFEEVLLGINPLYRIEVSCRTHEPVNSDARYYAAFKSSFILSDNGGTLIGKYGNGKTKEDAIKEYCRDISEKTMVINPYYENLRFEIKIPELYYKK